MEILFHENMYIVMDERRRLFLTRHVLMVQVLHIPCILELLLLLVYVVNALDYL